MFGFNIGGRRRIMFSRNAILLFFALLMSITITSRYLPSSHTPTAFYRPSFARSSSSGGGGGLGDWPDKIWQTWRAPYAEMEDELRYFATSWVHNNPGYRYELLLDEASRTYVHENYASRPDIMYVFDRISDSILRADYIRYLAVLADGGIYADIDTECSTPIDDWVPEQYRNVTGMVVGIEYDSRGGEVRPDFGAPVQLCQWSFMARAKNKVLQHVVDRVTRSLGDFGKASPVIEVNEDNRAQVWDITGPKIFTNAVLEAVSKNVGRTVSYNDITGLEEPKLMGDVLFMPVSAFGSGQEHSGSKPWHNEEQLVCHHFKRYPSWKPDAPQLWPEHGREHKLIREHDVLHQL